MGADLTDEELFKYKSLFKSRSKPASHFSALASLDNKTLKEKCPEPMQGLIEKAKMHLMPASASVGQE